MSNKMFFSFFIINDYLMKIFITKVFTTYFNTKKSNMVIKMFLSKINVTIFPKFGFFHTSL